MDVNRISRIMEIWRGREAETGNWPTAAVIDVRSNVGNQRLTGNVSNETDPALVTQCGSKKLLTEFRGPEQGALSPIRIVIVRYLDQPPLLAQ
jgi:hypothetical protein